MAPAIRAQISAELGVEPILINSALVSAQNRQRLYWTNIPGIEQPEDRGLVLRDILESGLPLREKGYTLKANYAKVNAVNAPDSGHFPATMAVEPVGVNRQGDKAETKTGLYTVPCAGRMVGRRINEQGHRDDYNEEIERFQRFEVNEEPQKTNCLSTVHKDNLIIQMWDGKTFPVYEVLNGLITIKGREYPIRLKDGFYIIRKLTVLECMRLQTVPEDYIFPVSNSQAYKMLGNGWTVDVISHILSYCPGILSEPLEVLSMYDGMGCGHLALDKLGAHIIRYYATEIDKYAIKTTQTNFPDTIQLGDAFGVREDGWCSFLCSGGVNIHAGL